MRTELHIVLCCCSRSAALLFAKSNAVVREEQRGRSRTATQTDKGIREKTSIVISIRTAHFWQYKP